MKKLTAEDRRRCIRLLEKEIIDARCDMGYAQCEMAEAEELLARLHKRLKHHQLRLRQVIRAPEPRKKSKS